MKITQIAIYTPNINETSENIRKHFLDYGYSDNLMMEGMFSGEWFESVGLSLFFFHNIIDGCELELIKSSSKYHWHRKKIKENGNSTFLSHLGVYVDDSDYGVVDSFKENFEILQESTSYGHSNKRSDGSNREYQDVIFDTESSFGFNIKFTKRI